MLHLQHEPSLPQQLFVFVWVPSQNLGETARQHAACVFPPEVRRRRIDTELLFAARILSTHLSEQVVFGLSFATQSAQCAHGTEPLTGIYCLCFLLPGCGQQFGFIV